MHHVVNSNRLRISINHVGFLGSSSYAQNAEGCSIKQRGMDGSVIVLTTAGVSTLSKRDHKSEERIMGAALWRI